MFRKLRRRHLFALLVVICIIHWSGNYIKEQPIEPTKEELVSNTFEHLSQARPIIEKKPVQKPAEFDVVVIDPEKPKKKFASKPGVALPPPPNVEQSIGNDEWISRTIYDSKGKCAQEIENQEIGNDTSNTGCQLPNLDLFNPTITKLMVNQPKSNCARYRSLGQLVDGKIEFMDTNIVSATYQPILRRGDFNYLLGKSSPVSRTKKIQDEFIAVNFLLRNGQRSQEFFLQPVIHKDLHNRSKENQTAIPINILIVAIHSLSHANAKRKLPNVYNYLKKKLRALIFNGHSVTGDGSTEQLTAMLTGKAESEQYEARRHRKNARPVDEWTWIYKQFKNHGYITGYSDDHPPAGPFQSRHLGFKDPPTDLYTRPFFLKASQQMQGNHRCLGSRSISQYQFNYIRDVFEKFPEKLKFLMTYNALFSYDDDLNNIGNIEQDLLSFLQDLKTNEHLKNTLLVVMGDHGSRDARMRGEIQGRLEERLPLFSITFPPWFASSYPNLYGNIRKNTNRLTTWYDVYATLRHILSYPETPAGLKHGQSLFMEVPASRSCKDADVAQHWCPCQEWSAVDIEHSHVQNAALAAVEYMNSWNKKHKLTKKYCGPLSLKSVNHAYLQRPNEDVLLFQETQDEDSKPVFNKKARLQPKDFCGYRLRFETSPNNGVYEATVRCHLKWFIVNSNIVKIDKHNNHANCIPREMESLRKFCSCRTSGNSAGTLPTERNSV